MSTLALFGGEPAISQPLKPFNSIGKEELQAATEVLESGVLSAYIGAKGDAFMGGEKVRKFEAEAAKYFDVKHAIVVNSWTSGLIAAVGAIGIEPGDEIITTPWTMAATATAILHWNGIPIFADIDPDSFNISPDSVEQLITPKTRAILAVDIFGQSADMKALRDIAQRHNLKLISDTAQAPGALYQNKYAGTLADIGGYSLNYHKHIHCGEGGVLVTNDDQLAERLCLIRNHAEAVTDADTPEDLCNLLGYNFRLGEIEAAIGSAQLKKLKTQVSSRQQAAKELNEGLNKLEGLRTPQLSKGCTHVYYVYGITLDTISLKVSRKKIINALKAEGVPSLMTGYANIHLLPLFQNKIAYGTKGFPWSSPYCSTDFDYKKGACPIAENFHHNDFLGISLCMFEFEHKDTQNIIKAFKKVWDNLDKL